MYLSQQTDYVRIIYTMIGGNVMSKKLYLILAISCAILCLSGAFYVIYNEGQVSPGYAIIPMLASFACVAGYRTGKGYKAVTQSSKYKYLHLGIGIGLPIGTATGVSYAVMSESNMGITIAIGAGIGLLIGTAIGNLLDHRINSKK